MLALAIPLFRDGCCAAPSAGQPKAAAPSAPPIAPPINLRREMSVREAMDSPSVFVDVISERLATVFLAEGPAPLQCRHHPIDEVEQIGGQQSVADHESVRAGLVDDLAHPVPHLLG